MMPKPMDASKFLQISSHSIIEYLKGEFAERAGLPKVEFMSGFPRNQEELKDQTESKKGFFSVLSGKTIQAYVSPYLVTRVQAERTAERETSTLIDDSSRKTIISKRGPETYKVKYLVLGPCFSTPEGQNLAAALISIFYDTRYLEIDIEGKTEKIQIEEPLQTADVDLERFLASAQIHRRPVYLFSATMNIASGRAIDTNRVVESRQIHFQKNFSNSSKSHLGGDPNL
jgi:hypothetical protein